ncbi:MAG: DUF5618 family protein [Tannerella sp.]|nr:DUF5618 family protein [Tannerella sp.]
MEKMIHPVREAERYLANAMALLTEKAGKDGRYYSDSKYVRMAGNTAWNGVLIALDGALGVYAGLKRKQRPEFKDYQAAVAKRDKRMCRPLLNAYELLHKSLGYDGVTNYRVVQESMGLAREILDWAEGYCRSDSEQEQPK